ncbi:MAG: amidohydrolase family protein [Clostridiales bacterium]|nr:amidohydrolase family protein [Clostridiales bacterium]
MIRLTGGSVAVIRDGAVCFEKKDIWFDPELDLILPEPSDTTVIMVETIDCTGRFITPGLFDSHIHGCFGIDISGASAEDIVKMSSDLARCGISAFLPTTMTMSEDRIRKALQAVSDACDLLENTKGPHADILGVHLEGPFLRSDKAGVQDKDSLMPLSSGIDLIGSLEKDFPGLIKIIDIAPELEGADGFCRRYAGRYVLSAAHSAADYDTALKFFAEGGSSVTHMLNAMEPCLKRAPGIPGAAYDSKDVFVELICDGFHVEPPVLRMVFELFEGRVVAVSDCMSAAGMPDGKYDLGGAEVEVRGGRTYSGTDGKLAGSVTLVSEAAQRLYGYGIAREKIADALISAPYRRLDLEVPELVPGARANVIIMDEDMRITNVFSNGHLV